MKGIAFLAWVLVLSLPCFASTPSRPLPFLSAADLTPYWNGEPGSEKRSPATVPSFELRNQANQSVSEADLKGHLSVVSFFFAQCGSVCPRLIQQIQGVQKSLSGNPKVRFYSLSVTPDEDSPGRLAEYAKTRRIDVRNWDLLTGRREVVYGLGRGVFKADKNLDGQKDDSDFIHSENLYLVDSELRVRGVYRAGEKDSIALLLQDVARLTAFPMQKYP